VEAHAGHRLELAVSLHQLRDLDGRHGGRGPRVAPGVDGLLHAASFLSGNRGRDRRRVPVAAKTAFATAGAIAMSGVSPAPAEGTSRRSMRTTSMGGTSSNRGTRYSDIDAFRMRPSSKRIDSNSAPPSPITVAPSLWLRM